MPIQDLLAEKLLAKSSYERWMITLTVMLVAILEVLDMTIVNVALKPMMGSLSATIEQITWVLTSYIVAAAIFMPLTGFLVKRYGRKQLLLANIVGFMLASILCGTAINLSEIVFLRILQGIFGAGLVPLARAILWTTFPKKDFGKATAIWAIGIMIAPILGPTLGGYICSHLSWRWIFYLNLPFCIFSFCMALRFIQETPCSTKQPIDWLGLGLMALGIGCLQIFLDQGNRADWFQSHFICLLAFISLSSLAGFIWRGLHTKNNIVNLWIFKDRNFALATIIMTLFCVCFIGSISVRSLLLENYANYPLELTGLVMAPRGITAAISMLLVNRLTAHFDRRKIMTIGLLFVLLGSYCMTHANLDVGPYFWMINGALQGCGLGLFFVPLSTLSLKTLPPADVPEASGLFGLGRSLGGSIGISILATLITRETQINWHSLGSHISTFNQNLHLWLNTQGWHQMNPLALHELARQVQLQSGLLAFLDSFWFVCAILLALIPSLYLLKQDH